MAILSCSPTNKRGSRICNSEDFQKKATRELSGGPEAHLTRTACSPLAERILHCSPLNSRILPERSEGRTTALTSTGNYAGMKKASGLFRVWLKALLCPAANYLVCQIKTVISRILANTLSHKINVEFLYCVLYLLIV